MSDDDAPEVKETWTVESIFKLLEDFGNLPPTDAERDTRLRLLKSLSTLIYRSPELWSEFVTNITSHLTSSLVACPNDEEVCSLCYELLHRASGFTDARYFESVEQACECAFASLPRFLGDPKTLRQTLRFLHRGRSDSLERTGMAEKEAKRIRFTERMCEALYLYTQAPEFSQNKSIFSGFVQEFAWQGRDLLPQMLYSQGVSTTLGLPEIMRTVLRLVEPMYQDNLPQEVANLISTVAKSRLTSYTTDDLIEDGGIEALATCVRRYSPQARDRELSSVVTALDDLLTTDPDMNTDMYYSREVVVVGGRISIAERRARALPFLEGVTALLVHPAANRIRYDRLFGMICNDDPVMLARVRNTTDIIPNLIAAADYHGDHYHPRCSMALQMLLDDAKSTKELDWFNIDQYRRQYAMAYNA